MGSLVKQPEHADGMPYENLSFTSKNNNDNDQSSFVHKIEQGKHDDGSSKPPQGCSLLTMFLVALPMVPIQMVWVGTAAAFAPWLNTILPSWMTLLTMASGPVTGFLVNPIIGAWSDSCTSRFGRRRPFIAFGATFTVVGWILMIFTKEIGEFFGDSGEEQGTRTATAIVYVVLMSWGEIGGNILTTPVRSLMADVAGERQVLGATISQGMLVVGALIIPTLTKVLGPVHEVRGPFMTIMIAVMVIPNLLVCLFVKETPLKEHNHDNDNDNDEAVLQGKTFFTTIWKGVTQMPRQLVIFGITMAAVFYGFQSYGLVFAQFIAIDVFGGDNLNADICGDACTPAQEQYNEGLRAASYPLFMGWGFTTIVIWLVPLAVSKLGSKKTLALALLPQALYVTLPFVKNLWYQTIVGGMGFMAHMVWMSLWTPIIFESMGGADALNTADIGVNTGILISFNNIGNILSTFIGSALVSHGGYSLHLLVGGCVSVLALVLLLCFHKLNFHSFN